MPRKKIVPTHEQRAWVRQWAANGTPFQQMCIKLGIPSVNTLRHYFHREIARGRIMGKLNTLMVEYKQAMSGKHLTATLRWPKTNAGWSNHMQLEAAKNRNPKTQNTFMDIYVEIPPRRYEEPPDAGDTSILHDPYVPSNDDREVDQRNQGADGAPTRAPAV